MPRWEGVAQLALLIIGEDFLIVGVRGLGDELAFLRFFHGVEAFGGDVLLLGKLHHIGARFFEYGLCPRFDGLRAHNGADAHGDDGERAILLAHKIGEDKGEHDGKADGVGLAAACFGEQDKGAVELGRLAALGERPCVACCPEADGDEQHQQRVEGERDIGIGVFHKAA